ncbi:MAG: hypothetical protein DMF82_25885 [Acidobacteria bacterium]|nr:MAG: hypothetical protein DMF82_25885 [Acidobacteriota bacterium]
MAGQASMELLSQMDRAHDKGLEEIDQMLRMVLQANEPTILEEESFRALMDLPNRTYTDGEGNRQPFLSTDEVAALSIRKGSLSEKERREIESHVTHTFKFLSQIPWTTEFRRVPDIAYAHHEKMDGTGYPRKLAAAERGTVPTRSRCRWSAPWTSCGMRPGAASSTCNCSRSSSRPRSTRRRFPAPERPPS